MFRRQIKRNEQLGCGGGVNNLISVALRGKGRRQGKVQIDSEEEGPTGRWVSMREIRIVVV